MNKYILIFLVIIFTSCAKKPKHNLVFSRINSAHSNINFNNKLTETDSLNYFNYPYIYMGGAVAVGDFNNDDLQDIYFTGNMVSNKLYLNKGNLIFEDITESAHAGLDNSWYLGATTIDINNDGWLDLYLSVSGKNSACPNKLLVNQGPDSKGHITFKEEARNYGIADNGHSTQSTFFDYDNDGDLDLYVANYPITPFSTTPDIFQKHIQHASAMHSNHLYENEGNGSFKDVTKEAGMLSYSLSLSATVSDLNNDGYKDIYVSNDFASADFCYINNRDGTFRNTIQQSTKHNALYGMGTDIADFNNDGHLDIFQVDMDASTNKRSKANMASMNPKVFWDTFDSGLYYQYMHNCLQLNTGILTPQGNPLFNNISRMAKVSSTDWSWGPLFADLDNDGWKDIFVSNGTRREINNTDFFSQIKAEKSSFSKKPDTHESLKKSLSIPSEKTDNFVYRNSKDLTFEKVNAEWGLVFEGFTNGVAYADLDNDGDLEIILNNIDDEAVIFQNNIENKNAIALKFKGPELNPRGIGVKCTVFSNTLKQFQELCVERGYLSAVSPILHFGLGDITLVDSIFIEWPNGNSQILKGIQANQTLQVSFSEAEIHLKQHNIKATDKYFNSDITVLDTLHRHIENDYDDYSKEILLPHKTSNFGPYISAGDLNSDGLDDFFISGASNQTSGLFYQNNLGSFDKQEFDFADNQLEEDMGSLIFDADNDGDMDLYVVSGGNEFEPNSKLLQDRLYVNNGQGKLSLSKTALPQMSTSGSRVYSFDYDQDGDLDVLVCGRLIPTNYPSPAKSYILENISTKQEVKFKDVTSTLIPEFETLGMATSASIEDIDGDGWQDIVITGEWMPIRVFQNELGNHFNEISESLGLKNSTGWWFSLSSGDFDNDGDIDFIAGNLGLNYKYKSSDDETFDIYFNDFDKNKKGDIVLSYYNEGKKYPVRGRSCSSQQIGEIKNKFKSYNEFAEATLVDVYGEEELKKSLHYQVNTFATTYIENKDGAFVMHQLPNDIQLSSVNQIIVKDFDKDGNLDVLAAGNLYASEIETPRNDAGTGIYLSGNGDGSFIPKSIAESGFYAPKDVKDMVLIKIGNEHKVIVANNNDFLKFISIKN